VVVETPEKLLRPLVADHVVSQAKLPKRLGAVPEVCRQRSHRLVAKAIPCDHESSHCNSQLRHLLEELLRSGILQTDAADIQHF